jgi:hypothetical protein
MERVGDNSQNVAINSTGERKKTHVYLQNTIDNLFKLIKNVSSSHVGCQTRHVGHQIRHAKGQTQHAKG